MPFELGLAVAIAVIDQTHDFRILDAVPYRVAQSLSDSAGYEPFIHNGNATGVFEAVLDAFVNLRAHQISDVEDFRMVYRGLQRYRRETLAGNIYRPRRFGQLVLAARMLVDQLVAARGAAARESRRGTRTTGSRTWSSPTPAATARRGTSYGCAGRSSARRIRTGCTRRSREVDRCACLIVAGACAAGDRLPGLAPCLGVRKTLRGKRDGRGLLPSQRLRNSLHIVAVLFGNRLPDGSNFLHNCIVRHG